MHHIFPWILLRKYFANFCFCFIFISPVSISISLVFISRYCRETGIILYLLLAGATHIKQPCDVGFFLPLKSKYKQANIKWQEAYPDRVLDKNTFPEVFKLAWDATVSDPSIAIHAFRKSGLYPFDLANIDRSRFTLQTTTSDMVIMQKAANI